MLPTAADEDDPTAVLWGKELRMGPGRVTSTAGGWMTTRDSSHCLTQGSLQLLASGVGPQGLQRLLQAMSVVWRGPVREGVEEAEGGGGARGGVTGGQGNVEARCGAAGSAAVGRRRRC